MNIEIANRLVKLRKENGYSQEQLADALGISRQAVSKWERAESSPDTDNLICLAKLYNVSLDELLQSSEEEVKEIIEINKDTTKEAESLEEKTSKEIDENNDEDDVTNYGIVGIILNVSTPIICTIIFFLFGFLMDKWHPAWLVFLFIPMILTFVEAIKKKNADVFAFPILVTFVFLLLGFLIGQWGIIWVVFLSIPLYYGIIEAINKAKKQKK